MSPQDDDTIRTPRPRASTSTFSPFNNWRRGRSGSVSTPNPVPPTPPLTMEALIEALTPPAVPSLTHARSLATVLATKGPNPRYGALCPIMASLCSADSPPALQAAGYDILTAYWQHTGPKVSTTGDRISCLSLFFDPAVAWSSEVWESRFNALVAIIQSGAQSAEMESDLLKVLESWVQGAFDGLTRVECISFEERAERERSVKKLTSFLTDLVGKSEFVSKLSDEDTSQVLGLWDNLLDRALSISLENIPLASAPASPVNEGHALKVTPAHKVPLTHRRHQSSTSIPQQPPLRHPADIVIDAYATYLNTRLSALAPHYLKNILPLLFRSLAYYSTPLPRISVHFSAPHQHALEKRIMEILSSLVSGPYSSSCTIIIKHYLFPTQKLCQTDVQTSVGALRTLRVSIREALTNRLARAFITRTASTDYAFAGVPTRMDLEREYMARAFPRDEVASWDLLKFRGVLCRAIKTWVDLADDPEHDLPPALREQVLTEAANIAKDVVQALDSRDNDDEVDDEEVSAVGDILRELVAYVQHLTDRDGGPTVLSLSHVDERETSPLLAAVSGLLGQDLSTSAIYRVLPSIILSVAGHLPDADTANLLKTMSERLSLSPMSLDWLDHWGSVLAIPGLFGPSRPRTRQNAMNILESVWDLVREIPDYRKPLAKLVFDFWKQQPTDRTEDVSINVIHILSDEAVLRTVESEDGEQSEPRSYVQELLEFLTQLAHAKEDDADDAASIRTADIPTVLSLQTTSAISAAPSPVLLRSHLEFPAPEKEIGLPSLSMMSSFITSTFNANHPSRSQSQPRASQDSGSGLSLESPPVSPPVLPSMPRSVGAVVALASVFSQLAFTPLAHVARNTLLTKQVFETLLDLLSTVECIRARLAVLQFLMRFRVDRDHKLYFASKDYDKDGNIAGLAALINRVPGAPSLNEQAAFNQELRSARPRVRQERDGRWPSRGRGGQSARLESSRSRSRTNPRLVSASTSASLHQLKPREPTWSIPETLPFKLEHADTASEVIMSYDPSAPWESVVLPWSRYLRKLVDIIENEKDWEILSYVLCHLPTQLANKHLFCGPNSADMLRQMVTSICAGIRNNTFAANIERWPESLIARDAHGLAYHTLTVLISYKRTFTDLQVRHQLADAFLQGLSGQPSTIRCCLHALSLAAFELQPSMTKYMSTILGKLSHIMSNSALAVHIIDFLAIVGSLPMLQSNFTDDDYKLVFGVALQYLQHYNHSDDMPISWALAQHVRIMSYYIIYLWFLAVDLPDRPRHIKFISRQLLLANEGRGEIDEPTEVCFDWLARYTYASADPRPAHSMLSEVVMNPNMQQHHPEPAVSEKTWVGGTAVVTVRTLARRGWIEVVTRRSSGLTKFLCRAENVPMVTVGDVDPDMASVAASLTLDRDYQSRGAELPQSETSLQENNAVMELQNDLHTNAEDSAQKPDPITGYVWSGSAPSQRRKDVAMDPAYFVLQLSSYPDSLSSAKLRPVPDSTRLQSFFRSFDRMPVIDTHKVGIMYVAPGQKEEGEILRNRHGSPAYTRFLESLARLINLRGQKDVYAGGLDPDEDGEYAYAWWDDTGQILYHTATLMPASDPSCLNKKAHIGNDYVRIVWNDSGLPYRFDTLATQFQFVNIVIEPHSHGAIAAFSNNLHENEYFKVTIQRAPGMPEFTPVGDFKLISAENLPLLVRQISLLSDWFSSVYQHTKNDTERTEMITNWRSRLQAIKRFRAQTLVHQAASEEEDGRAQISRDFTTIY